MLSLARRAEDVRRPADRATRESEGSASSGEHVKHRGRRHRLAGSLIDKLRCPRGGARALAPADPRHTKLIQKIILKNPEDNMFIPVIG
jgi:hypothetical protein